MNQERKSIFKKLLLEKRKKAIDERVHFKNILDGSRDEATDVSRYSSHLADDSSDSTIREETFYYLSRENTYLSKIEEALESLENDTYGICRECGIEISEERLMAVPTTSICIDCKSKQEKVRKITND